MSKNKQNTEFNYASSSKNTQNSKRGFRGPSNMVSSKEKQSLSQMVNTLKKVFIYIGKHKKVLIFGLILACASSILMMLGPTQIGRMTDIIQQGINTQIDFSAICVIGFILIAIYGSSNLFSFIQQYMMAGMTAKVCKKLRSDFIEKLNKLPHSYFNTHLQGDILSCITNDVQTLRQGISRSIPNIMKAFAQFITCIIVMIITE